MCTGDLSGDPKISMIHGIMERSSDVLVLSGDFGWNDVGSWDMMKGHLRCGARMEISL